MPAVFVNGEWSDDESFGTIRDGQFQRTTTMFRKWITADGSSGIIAEPDRYHLYFSHACPWAHRTVIFLKLKKLDEIISSSSVEAILSPYSWKFGSKDSKTEDPLYHFQYLYELYLHSDPHYTGRITVPVLWDKKERCIVNNESSEIIRMLNREFNAFTDEKYDFYPLPLQSEIDAINSYVYDKINNGVYKCGFSEEQEAYEEAFNELFEALDLLEDKLSNQNYLVGNQLTEADIRLFTTLVRFDPVYHYHFKCNLKKIADYPNLSKFLLRIINIPNVRQTVVVSEFKNHYYKSHPKINPLGIIPKGPILKW